MKWEHEKDQHYPGRIWPSRTGFYSPRPRKTGFLSQAVSSPNWYWSCFGGLYTKQYTGRGTSSWLRSPGIGSRLACLTAQQIIYSQG